MAERGRGSVMPIVDTYAHKTYTTGIQTEHEKHMRAQSKPRPEWERIEIELSRMTLEELLELRALVDTNIDAAELRERRIELGLEEPEESPVAENGAGEKSKGGKGGYVELKMINGCGPYAYKRFRKNGRLCSEYVGKVKE